MGHIGPTGRLGHIGRAKAGWHSVLRSRFSPVGHFCSCGIYKKLYNANVMAKSLKFVGSSLDDLRDFPDEARRSAGFELRAVQNGLEPSDWKPMRSVGPGVKEIRIRVVGE